MRSALLPLFWLVEDGFKRDSVDYGLRSEAWGVLEDLVKIGAADGEYEEYPGRTGALDMCLNNLNGVSFHALYQYAAWRRTHDESLTLVKEAKRIFEQYLDGDDHTASRHAVLGTLSARPLLHGSRMGAAPAPEDNAARKDGGSRSGTGTSRESRCTRTRLGISGSGTTNS